MSGSIALAVVLATGASLPNYSDEGLLFRGHIKNDRGEIVKGFAEIVKPGAKLSLSAKTKNTYVSQFIQVGEQKPKPEIAEFETGISVSIRYSVNSKGNILVDYSTQDVYENEPPAKLASVDFPGTFHLLSISLKEFSGKHQVLLEKPIRFSLDKENRYTLDLTVSEI